MLDPKPGAHDSDRINQKQDYLIEEMRNEIEEVER
jgi:hypothetical protein